MQEIENMIYEIRGKQVMLDSDLAKLYKCKNGTKEINQAVKNNINKFPIDFAFVLNNIESKNLLVKIFDQKKELRGGRYKNPRVFTEEGILMLATILKSEMAIKMSIKIINVFVSMRKYIGSNLIEQKYINNMVLEHDSEIKILFDKLEEKKVNNEIYFNGMIYDSYSKILDIFSKTKNELIIIDNYADKVILDIVRRLKVSVILITSNKLLSVQDIEKYNKQYNNLKVMYDNTFHDRYFILDKKIVYHCGTSVNRIGYKTFSINLISDIDIINALLNRINL
ncbi:MAG: ORF6N domain-containing protein [Bacilli bacterium]|nr:ORF6N domain-containing protein [Bacilli bacterium]